MSTDLTEISGKNVEKLFERGSKRRPKYSGGKELIARRIFQLWSDGLSPAEIQRETGFQLNTINATISRCKKEVEAVNGHYLYALVREKLVQIFGHHSEIAGTLMSLYLRQKDSLMAQALPEAKAIRQLTLLMKELQRNDKTLATWMIAMGVAASGRSGGFTPPLDDATKNNFTKKIAGMREDEVKELLRESVARINAYLEVKPDSGAVVPVQIKEGAGYAVTDEP